MNVAALAYKRVLTLDEAARLILDGGNKGIDSVWSLLREAVESGSLEAEKLVRHSRYDWNLAADVPDSAGAADLHETTVQRTKLVDWLVKINYQPRPKLLFPDSPHLPKRVENDGRQPRWSKWRLMPEVRIWEAISLSLDIEPTKIKTSRTAWMGERHPFDEGEEFDDRLEILRANIANRAFFPTACTINMGDWYKSGVKLSEFSAFASKVAGWQISDELAALSPVPDNDTASIRLPTMYDMARIMADSGYVEEEIFDMGMSGEIQFLVVVPTVGACEVPNNALAHFAAGADSFICFDMPEHWSRAKSGQWRIERERLRILASSWERYSEKVLKIAAMLDKSEQTSDEPQQSLESQSAKSSNDWKVRAQELANNIGLQKYSRGERQITARAISGAVANELGKERRYWGNQGPRSESNVRNEGLKGWKFVPPDMD